MSNNKQAGIITLEIMIALAIITTIISAVILVVFGNQTIASDTETNNEALYLAQARLEKAQTDAANSFNSIISASTNITSGPLTYQVSDTVTDISQCLKQLLTNLTWTMEGRDQYSELTTLLSSPKDAYALGGDCISDPPGGSPTWRNPQTFTTADIDPGGNKGTDIDVIKINGHKYGFLTSVHSAIDKDDFWVFDLETTPPSIIGRLNTGPGLNAVDVAQSSNGNFYAFVANNNTIVPHEQLIVINVTTPTTPAVVTRVSLPSVSGADPAGRAIFYYKNLSLNKDLIYIGTRLTAGSEFHIFDVTNPATPIALGQREINHSIRKIVVSNSKAYLATTSNSNELMILDVTNPTSIQPPWGGPGSTEPGFDATGNEDGESVFIIGNSIYLGRARAASSRPELYILNATNLSVIASKNLNLNPSTAQVSDIAVYANFIFLGTSDSNAEFQVWNLDDLSTRWSSFNFPQAITGIEFMDGKVYASVDSNNALHVIYDAP